MLTKLRVKRFKRFDDVEIELGSSVVLVGPNNSGKTTALQALALWHAGCQQWLAKRNTNVKRDATKGVTIGRKDVVFLPLASAKALWYDLKVREGIREGKTTRPKNVLIEIIAEGVDSSGPWECGLEFDYVSEEFFYCRPARLSDGDASGRMPFPHERVKDLKLAFLPPMSGLVLEEPLLQAGRIDTLLGAGRSGEVLRNLCYSAFEKKTDAWPNIVRRMRELFGIRLLDPEYVQQLGTVEVEYEDTRKQTLSLASAGLGMQQTLLLLAYMSLNPNTLLMLDEPDAHLEVLRQRQVYQLVTSFAAEAGCQVVCASHSEVVLNEAIARDRVVAFVGKPHTVSGATRVLQALRDVGFEQYLQAEQTGWVLYLEGSTDLAILQAWALRLNHHARECLARPFVHYLNSNVPSHARNHFAAVREAKPSLLGVALFDRLELQPQGEMEALHDMQWERREIENYFVKEKVLLAYARGQSGDLIQASEGEWRVEAMQNAIKKVQTAVQTLYSGEEIWSHNLKASEQVLQPILSEYARLTRAFQIPSKGEYHNLIAFQDVDEIPREVVEKLDAIAAVASNARP